MKSDTITIKTPIPQVTKSCLSKLNKLSLKRPPFGGLALGLASLASTSAEASVYLVKERRQMRRSLSYSERKKRDEMFQQGMLWCSDCNLFQPVKEFGTAKDSCNYGYLVYCRPCKAIRDKDSYKRNNGHTARNGALKAKFVELAGGVLSAVRLSSIL